MYEGITVHWHNADGSLDYQTYPRHHEWVFSNGVTVPVSASPAFLGDPDCINPEQGLVASLSSCHMLTFIALASKSGWRLSEYRDHPSGEVGQRDDGRTAVTAITLRPRIRCAGEPPGREEVEALHAAAHKHCFVANSLNARMIIKPVLGAEGEACRER